MRFFCADSTNIKIRIPLYLPNPPRVKDQRETKDEPMNDQRTPNHQKSTFIKISLLNGVPSRVSRFPLYLTYRFCSRGYPCE